MATSISKKTTFYNQSLSERGRMLIYLAVILLVIAGALIWFTAGQGMKYSTLDGFTPLSAADLEARYGLMVKLVGVTAGGGMIDVRFKVVDAEKAAVLLQDPDSLPKLQVKDGITLATGQAELEDVHLEDGGIVFMLFSNAGGAVRTGTPIHILFGKMKLEAVIAQ